MEDSAKNVLGKWTMTLFYRLAIYEDFRMGQKVSPVKLKRHMTYPNIVTIVVVGLMTWWAGVRTNTMVVLPAEFGHLSTKRHPTVGEWVSSGYFFSECVGCNNFRTPSFTRAHQPLTISGDQAWWPTFSFPFLFIIGTNFGSILDILATNFFLTHSKIGIVAISFFYIQHRSHFLRMRPFWKATMQFGWSRCLARHHDIC